MSISGLCRHDRLSLSILTACGHVLRASGACRRSGLTPSTPSEPSPSLVASVCLLPPEQVLTTAPNGQGRATASLFYGT